MRRELPDLLEEAARVRFQPLVHEVPWRPLVLAVLWFVPVLHVEQEPAASIFLRRTLKRRGVPADEGLMSSLPEYDPRVIEQFAEKLYRKASAFVVGSVAIGAALGAAFGAVPLTSLGASWPVPSIFGFATLL